jgi:hypothetical protein
VHFVVCVGSGAGVGAVPGFHYQIICVRIEGPLPKKLVSTISRCGGKYLFILKKIGLASYK